MVSRILPNYIPTIQTVEKDPTEWGGMQAYPFKEGETIRLGGEPSNHLTPIQEMDWEEGYFNDIPWREQFWIIRDHPNLMKARDLTNDPEVLKLYKVPYQLKWVLHNKVQGFKLNLHDDYQKAIKRWEELELERAGKT